MRVFVAAELPAHVVSALVAWCPRTDALRPVASESVHLTLAFNPSPLEVVAPVVQGGCRARQDRHADDARDLVLPVIVHGDAAFIGQGVVTETLNLSKTPAYGTGGSQVHGLVELDLAFVILGHDHHVVHFDEVLFLKFHQRRPHFKCGLLIVESNHDQITHSYLLFDL